MQENHFNNLECVSVVCVSILSSILYHIYSVSFSSLPSSLFNPALTSFFHNLPAYSLPSIASSQSNSVKAVVLFGISNLNYIHYPLCLLLRRGNLMYLSLIIFSSSSIFCFIFWIFGFYCVPLVFTLLPVLLE